VSIIPPPGLGHKAEFVEWRWQPMEDLLQLIVPFKRDVYRDVLAEFSALGR
jgi:putative (di)nucleoside polyphosphate hydrolase